MVDNLTIGNVPPEITFFHLKYFMLERAICLNTDIDRGPVEIKLSKCKFSILNFRIAIEANE